MFLQKKNSIFSLLKYLVDKIQITTVFNKYRTIYISDDEIMVSTQITNSKNLKNFILKLQYKKIKHYINIKSCNLSIPIIDII